MANRMHFYELLKGAPNGRKIAYADVEKIDETNIVKILGQVIGIHNYNKTFIKYLWDYKNGDQPARYRTKTIRDDINNVVVENHAWEIVRFKNGQTNGESRQLVATKKDDNINNAIDEFNTYTQAANKQVADINAGEWVSSVGFGYEAIQLKHKAQIPFRFVACSPMNTFIVYSSITRERLMSVQELKDEDGYRYYQCYTDTHEYKIKDSKIEYAKLHIFGGIPIVEICNNQSRVSDIELVIDLLDAISDLQSNRSDSVAQFVQSYFKFINCEIDSEKFEQMKKSGAISVKTNSGSTQKAEVDIITQELNQTQTQTYKDDLIESMLTISAIPSKDTSGGGGDRAGATYLKNGWDFAKQAAMMKDPYTKQAEKYLTDIALNIIHKELGNNVCNMTVLDYDIQIPHSPTDNMLSKAEALQLLLNAGIHPLVAIKTCGLWSDSEKVYIMSKEYLNKIDKAIEDNVPDAIDQEQKAKELLDNANSNR